MKATFKNLVFPTVFAVLVTFSLNAYRFRGRILLSYAESFGGYDMLRECLTNFQTVLEKILIPVLFVSLVFSCAKKLKGWIFYLGGIIGEAVLYCVVFMALNGGGLPRIGTIGGTNFYNALVCALGLAVCILLPRLRLPASKFLQILPSVVLSIAIVSIYAFYPAILMSTSPHTVWTLIVTTLFQSTLPLVFVILAAFFALIERPRPFVFAATVLSPYIVLLVLLMFKIPSSVSINAIQIATHNILPSISVVFFLIALSLKNRLAVILSAIMLLFLMFYAPVAIIFGAQNLAAALLLNPAITSVFCICVQSAPFFIKSQSTIINC